MFREGEHVLHPVAGKDLGAPTLILGKARVADVYDDFSVAEVVRTDSGATIAPMGMVITK